MDSKLLSDPFEANRPARIDVEVYHSDAERQLINGYLKQCGDTLIGLGRILLRSNMNRMYRNARSLDGETAVAVAESQREDMLRHNNLT